MNALQDLFITVLNMSITASYAAVGVIFARIALRKAPKIYSYALWAVVLFRLICPTSFTTAFSFIGLVNRDSDNSAGVMAYVSYDLGVGQTSMLQSGISSVDSTLNSSLPMATPVASANPMQIWIGVLSLIWLIGIFVLLSYSAISYLKITKRLRTATLVEDNIYVSDQISTAFVCGFVRPKIYVPLNVEETDLSYIMEHERTHIRRRDYLIKPFAFLALVLHWFNPLMWLSFRLMSRDMEMSCDESVLQKMGEGAKGAYSRSLLSLSAKKIGHLTANPLAFGESHVKARIKNTLNYKKPGFWVLIISAIAVAGIGVALMSNPVDSESDLSLLNPQFTKDAAELQKRVDSGEAELQALLDPMSSATLILGLNGGYFSSELLSTSPLKLEYNWDYQKAEIEMYQPIKKGEGGIWLVKTHDIIDVQPGREIVEENLAVIMSSPQTSSNPQDYIREHQNEYENILKGGEGALTYMLSQFENGNADGLRGQIMMRLCKDLLGARNNVTDETLSPQQWYAALSVQQETKLPDFVYDGGDPIEKLVYSTEVERNSQPDRGFTVVAPKIFGSYEEGGFLKVFVTTYSATYTLYGNALQVESGGVVPSAITYKKDDKGNYVLYDYEQAADGSYFASSIRDYCTMPVSKQEIPGLSDEILNHYGNYEDIRVLHRENLAKHLRTNGITDATLMDFYGQIEFTMDNPVKP